MYGALAILSAHSIASRSALAAEAPSGDFLEYVGSLVERDGGWVGPDDLTAPWLDGGALETAVLDSVEEPVAAARRQDGEPPEGEAP